MKKGQTALVGIMISLLVLLIIGIGVVIPVVSSIATNSNLLQSVSLEVHNFTTNNTNVQLAQYPIDETINTATLYYDSAGVYPLPATKFTFTDATGLVKIYTNSSVVGRPNVTANTNYYASYDWQPANYIVTSAIVGFIVLLLVVVIIVGVISFTGFGK